MAAEEDGVWRGGDDSLSNFSSLVLYMQKTNIEKVINDAKEEAVPFLNKSDTVSKITFIYDYSKRIAFVGSMREIIIDGNTNIATDKRNITIFRGNNHHENSIGTLSI